VRAHNANSHAKQGWEQLTDAAVAALSQKRSGLVFLLWGKPAQDKGKVISRARHQVLTSAHPSPLSATRVGAQAL
jgi:uracil-DNA glycosylase